MLDTKREVGRPAVAAVARKPAHAWWRLLLAGLLLFAIGVGVLAVTQNPTLFPTVVLLGNFTVPVAFVAFLYERRHLSKLSMSTTVMAFVFGGVVGVLAAGTLEPLFVPKASVLAFIAVALIEEFVKILGVLGIARLRRHDAEIDGMILGAAAGMGFAALESSGYAFSAFMSSQGSLSATVGVTLLRGLLAAAGHGTWTAILAGVLFRESAPRKFRVDAAVIGAYLLVVVLHWSWDAIPFALSSQSSQTLLLTIPDLAVGAIGLFVLWRRWHEAVKLQERLCNVEPQECEPAQAKA